MDYFEEQEYTKDLDLSLWRKIIRIIIVYKKYLIRLFIMMALLAVGDSIYPLFTKYAYDNFIGKNDMSNIGWFVFFFAILIISQGLIIFAFIDNNGKLECSVVHLIRSKGFKRLQELSFSYYDTTPVGWIMARMTGDAQRIGDIIAWGLCDFIWGLCVIFIGLVIMFIINWQLALLAITVIPILGAVSVYFQKRILKSHREIKKTNSKITASFNEGINGAKTTKTLAREGKNFEEFAELSGHMRSQSIRAAVFSAVYWPIIVSAGSIGVGLVLYRGGHMALDDTISLGTLAVFVTYTAQMFEPINQIARLLSEFQSAQASAERTLTLLETEPDIIDSDEVISKYGSLLDPKTENWEEINGDIEFNNVSFSYKTGEKVLENFSLKVSPGEKIALVGETGSGKSTIVNLICRFYEPTEGKILIDGADYRERSQIWLHSNLGYVLQTPHLFSGTIMENIRYAKLDATDEEVIEAAKKVNAVEFISKLEKGFDTSVGEGGNRLSSGEKQLVSFARAILANPKLFILDEATSSIDTETEQIIQKSVDEILKGRTSFIVAHRLSTIRKADRILVIDNGKVIESGNHKELLKQRGHYYNLYTNQFKKEAEERIMSE